MQFRVGQRVTNDVLSGTVVNPSCSVDGEKRVVISLHRTGYKIDVSPIGLRIDETDDDDFWAPRINVAPPADVAQFVWSGDELVLVEEL